jgi:hypothetical protein
MAGHPNQQREDQVEATRRTGDELSTRYTRTWLLATLLKSQSLEGLSVLLDQSQWIVESIKKAWES